MSDELEKKKQITSYDTAGRRKNVIFWTNDSKRWIVNIWQSQEYYRVWAVLRRPNFITGHTWHLLSFLLKSKPNWGRADTRRKGKKVYITVYMIFRRKKSEREEDIFHIKKQTNKQCHIWAHFTGYMKTAYKFIKPLSSHSRDIYFLVMVNIIINIILAAAQISNFLRLGSVTV